MKAQYSDECACERGGGGRGRGERGLRWGSRGERGWGEGRDGGGG